MQPGQAQGILEMLSNDSWQHLIANIERSEEQPSLVSNSIVLLHTFINMQPVRAKEIIMRLPDDSVQHLITNIESSAKQPVLASNSLWLLNVIIRQQSGQAEKIIKWLSDDSIKQLIANIERRVSDLANNSLALFNVMIKQQSGQAEGIIEKFSNDSVQHLIKCAGSADRNLAGYSGMLLKVLKVLRPELFGTAQQVRPSVIATPSNNAGSQETKHIANIPKIEPLEINVNPEDIRFITNHKDPSAAYQFFKFRATGTMIIDARTSILKHMETCQHPVQQKIVDLVVKMD